MINCQSNCLNILHCVLIGNLGGLSGPFFGKNKTFTFGFQKHKKVRILCEKRTTYNKRAYPLTY